MDNARYSADADGTGRFVGIIHWNHRRGGPAHCLARLYVRPGAAPVAVVSEIRSNERGKGIMSDLATVADAVVAAAAAVGMPPLDPASAVWVAHHGDFSYWYEPSPESFLLVGLRWDGHRYQEVESAQRWLSDEELADLLGAARLDAVPAALSDLGPGLVGPGTGR